MQKLKQLLIDDVVSVTGSNASGLVYNLFKATSNNEALREAAEAMLPKLPVGISVIVAPGLGAAAFAYALALLMPTPVQVLTVRDPAKSRVGETLLEGPIPTTPSDAVFVDDIIITGSTFKQTVETLAKYAPAVKVVCCACILDSWQPTGSRYIHASGTPVYSVLRRHDIGLTRDCSSSGRSGPRISALGERISVFKINGLNDTRPKSNPILLRDRVILADDTHTLRCMSLTGETIWQCQPGRAHPKGIVQNLQLQIDSTLLIGGYAGIVGRFNSATGACIWVKDVASSVHATPIVDDSTSEVYVVGEEFDPATRAPGGSITKLAPDGEKLQYRRFSNHFAPAQCTLVGSTVAVTANDGVLRCFDKDLTLPERWATSLPGLVRGSVLHVGDLLFMATESGHVLAINAVSGAIEWMRRAAKEFRTVMPQVCGALAIVCDTAGFVHGFNWATGERVWLARLRSTARQRPTVVGPRRWLFAGVGGDVNMLDPVTGEKLAQTRTGVKILQPGSVHNGSYALFGADGVVQIYKCHDLRS